MVEPVQLTAAKVKGRGELTNTTATGPTADIHGPIIVLTYIAFGFLLDIPPHPRADSTTVELTLIRRLANSSPSSVFRKQQ